MHVEKYAKAAVGHMLRHYNRTVLFFSNEDIDHMRSDFNYNLVPDRHMEDISYYRQRLSQVKCQNRVDVKTLCDWVITLPKQPFTETEEKRFFKLAYNFMTRRYGEENTISSWVHKDEAGQPHMHFCFIPICLDKRKGIKKVSAKEILTRSDLQVIHKEMSAYMKKFFGRDVGILNGATVGGNKSVIELKLQGARDELSTIEEAKSQSVIELAQTIKNKPSLISDITHAIRIAMDKEQLPLDKKAERLPERSR